MPMANVCYPTHAGNKTSHLAALLHEASNSGGGSSGKQPSSRKKTSSSKPKQHAPKVFALDRDASRLAILRRRVVDTMGAGEIVVPLLQDFLALDPADARMVNVSTPRASGWRAEGACLLSSGVHRQCP